MRKKIAILLSVALLFSFRTPIFAESIESNSASIKATYIQPSPATAYSVDIVWGNMEFNYDSGKELQWDPVNLIYKEVQVTTPSWSPVSENGNIVTVTNHSNVAILASIAYQKETVNGVEGTVNNAQIRLDAPEIGSARNTAPSDFATVMLHTQNLPNSFAEGAQAVKLGSVTVTITKAAEAKP